MLNIIISHIVQSIIILYKKLNSKLEITEKLHVKEPLYVFFMLNPSFTDRL